MLTCETDGCAEPVDDSGDGYSGYGPSCADKLSRLEESDRVIDYDNGRIDGRRFDLDELDRALQSVGE